MRIFLPLLRQAVPKADFFFKTGGYNKYGLKRDDLLFDMDPQVQEAVRRLPEEVRSERVFRLKRAIHLSTTQAILPESEWTKPEEDERYLTPYLNEVIQEDEEKKNWGKD